MSLVKKHIKIINYKMSTFTENILNINFLDNNIKANPTASEKDREIGIGYSPSLTRPKTLDRIN